MNAPHLTGAGLGAIVGIVLVSLGTRIGLDLTDVDSASLGIGAIAVGGAVVHGLWTVGLVPIVKQVVFGPKKLASAVKSSTRAAKKEEEQPDA